MNIGFFMNLAIVITYTNYFISIIDTLRYICNIMYYISRYK